LTRLLVLGTGPLIEPGMRLFSAHCLRTSHFVEPLREAGHEVRLFTLPIPAEDPATQIQAGVEERRFGAFAYVNFRNNNDAYNLERLAEAARAFQPQALLAVNSYPCALLSRLPWQAPLWADLNGSVVVEGQVKAAVEADDANLGLYWAMEEAALRRADKFSVVSRRQLYFLYGELAAVGRLNRFTAGYAFAHHVPNAVNPFFARQPGPTAGSERRLRGRLVPETAFITLWSGGYNTWTDLETLLTGLERAMAACPEMHYVSTGGGIRGHHEATYDRFQTRVRRSPFADRFHLLGWVEAADLPGIYAEADLGLCIDAPNTETTFGARNRSINMAAAGLPVLACEGAEISEEMLAAGVALGCRLGEPEDFARALIAACRDRENLPALGAKGRAYVLEQFNAHRTVEALLAWVRSPAFAPDHARRIESAPAGTDPFAFPMNPIEERWARQATATPGGGHPTRNSWAGVFKRGLRTALGPAAYERLRRLKRRRSDGSDPGAAHS